MRKTVPVLVLSVVSCCILMCGGGAGDALDYSSVNVYDWVQASVRNRESKHDVMWFQVFDQTGNGGIVKSYQGSSEKVGHCPASIFENKYVWVLVNNRFEIRLMADDRSPDFQNTKKLKDFIRRFDLAGMESYNGPKLKGEEIRKFIPKL